MGELVISRFVQYFWLIIIQVLGGRDYIVSRWKSIPAEFEIVINNLLVSWDARTVTMMVLFDGLRDG